MARISIGLDVGPRTVRAIALTAPSRAERTAGQVGRIVASASVARLTSDGAHKPLPAALAEAQAALGVKGNTAVHLGDAKVLFRFLATLPLSPERTAKVLRLELASHAADDGDLAADAWNVDLPGEETIHGCAVASPTDLYAGMVDLAEGGWKRYQLGSGPVAAFNATLPTSPARGEAIHLLMDVGPTSTALTLFGEDRLLACRTIGMGQENFAEALRQDARRVPTPAPRPVVPAAPVAAAAELALDDLSFADPVIDTQPASSGLMLEDIPPSAPAPTLDLDDGPSFSIEDESPSLSLDDPTSTALPTSDLPSPGEVTLAVARAELGPEATRIAEQLASQIASSVLWFRQQLKRSNLLVNGIHLTGEGAAIPGLDHYLGRRFSCPAAVFHPTELLAGTVPGDSFAWTTAIGLALPGLGLRKTVALDLRPESLVLRETRRRHVVGPLVAAGFLVAAAIPVGITCWRQQQAAQESLAAWQAYAADHTKLAADLTAIETEKNALGEDLRAIAGRIASGENLLLAVRALKEQAPKSEALWVTSMSTDRVVADDDKPKIADKSSSKKVADTAIDRGALLVDARIKFDSGSTGVERDAFRKAYQQALETWRPRPDAPPLFADSRVEKFVPDAEAGRGGKSEGTAFIFTIRFVFRPTDLTQVTMDRRANAKAGAP